MADSGTASEITQRQSIDADLAEHRDRLLEEHGTEVAVMEGPIGHGGILSRTRH